MLADNVTLIVKAPNQQIEDKNIDCETSWTVRELKGHISEVYPSKPKIEEQKIIYSGRLLDDNLILKDVLHNYYNQLTHTIHLVCTPNRHKMAEEPNTDGVRRRPVEQTEMPRPERQNDQNHSVEMQNYLSSLANNYGRVPQYPVNNGYTGYLPAVTDPALLSNQMLMMQQAYFQYMQHYANMYQFPTNPPAEAPVAQPVAPEVPAAPEDDGEAPRDWLDYVYAGSRLAIIFSMLYLYSNPFRLALVMLLFMLGYLYQLGYFREMGFERQQEAPRPEPRPEPAREGHTQTDGPAPDAPTPDGPAPDGAVPDGPRPDGTRSETVPVQDVNQNQSVLAITWMIFTSFFTSLIPEMN